MMYNKIFVFASSSVHSFVSFEVLDSVPGFFFTVNIDEPL